MAKFHIFFLNSNITPEKYGRLQEFLALLNQDCKVHRKEATKIHDKINWLAGVSIDLPDHFSVAQEKGGQKLFYHIKTQRHLVAWNNAKTGTHVDLENLRTILGKDAEQEKKSVEMITKQTSSYECMMSLTIPPEKLLTLLRAVKSVETKPLIPLVSVAHNGGHIVIPNITANGMSSKSEDLLVDIPLSSPPSEPCHDHDNNDREEEEYDFCTDLPTTVDNNIIEDSWINVLKK